MQEILNSNWYAHNELISYPLDGTGIDDNGNVMPSTLITDLRIVSSIDLDFYIGGVTCSEYIISVIVCSARGTETMITVPQPVTPETHYAMESLSDEVSGVIAFGHTDNYGQWRFTTADQSRLCPSCQIKLQRWPVSSLSAGVPLQGDILIEAGHSVTVQIEEVALGNTRAEGANPTMRRQAITFRLQPTADETEKGSAFLGGCHARPDNSDGSSRECPYIVNLGDASPDYNGNIEISLDMDDSVSEIYDSYNISTFGDLIATECGTERSCSNVSIGITEKQKEREPMEFGQCGVNKCEETRETDTTTYTSVDLNNIYPLQGNGIALSNRSLTSLEGESVIAANETGTQIQATFHRNGTGHCGIYWGGSAHSFQYDGTTLSMDNDQITVSTSVEDIVLTLTLEGNTITGTLSTTNIVIGMMHCDGDSLGETGIILENWSCTDWRIQ